MGRTPGSQNKPKAATNAIKQTSRHTDGPVCPYCSGWTYMTTLGERCSECFRTNPNGQKVTSGFQSNRFKVKELDGPRFNAAFKVIDYAV